MIHYYFLFFILILFTQEACVLDINQATHGGQSPAIIAENIHITYGVPPNITHEIIKVYEKENTSPEKRNAAVKSLIKKYKSIANKEDELTEEQKKFLEIQTKEEIANILNYDIFISTKGHQSPAIFAPGGYAEIWYGIPPQAFKGIWQILEKKQVALEGFDKKLQEQIKKFKELERELAARIGYDEIAAKAKTLLDLGDIDGAERILEEEASRKNKKTAYLNHEVGRVKELNLKYKEATEYYKLAALLDKQNLAYLLSYGYNLIDNARYDEAIKQFSKLLQALPEKNNLNEQAARSYNNLGVAYAFKGANDKAIEHYRNALNIWFNILGENHPNITKSYNNLGGIYDKKGNYDKAIEYYSKALNIDRKTLGENHPNIARSYNNLGETFRVKGKYDKAIEHHKKALNIWFNTLEENHPNIAKSYNNLGTAYSSKEKYDEAIEYYEKALNIDRNSFGETHPNIARSYNNLGIAYFSKGAYDKAIEYYNEALNIWFNALGKNHPNIAKSYNNLGLAYSSKEEYDKAIEYYNEALNIDRKTIGENHPNIAIRYNNLGEAYAFKGEKGEAIEVFKKAKSILKQFLPPDHPHMKTIQGNINDLTAVREEKSF